MFKFELFQYHINFHSDLLRNAQKKYNPTGFPFHWPSVKVKAPERDTKRLTSMVHDRIWLNSLRVLLHVKALVTHDRQPVRWPGKHYCLHGPCITHKDFWKKKLSFHGLSYHFVFIRFQHVFDCDFQNITKLNYCGDALVRGSAHYIDKCQMPD